MSLIQFKFAKSSHILRSFASRFSNIENFSFRNLNSYGTMQSPRGKSLITSGLNRAANCLIMKNIIM